MKKNNTENNIINHKDAIEAADERAETGKKHITDIAMITSNNYSVIDSLMCILELFTVKRADVSVCDLADELQGYLFRWTKEYGNALDGWKDSVMFGDKYEDAPEVEAKPTLEDHQRLNNLAADISAVLKNPLTPKEIYNVLADELSETVADTDSPEWILGNLKMMKEQSLKA